MRCSVSPIASRFPGGRCAAPRSETRSVNHRQYGSVNPTPRIAPPCRSRNALSGIWPVPARPHLRARARIAHRLVGRVENKSRAVRRPGTTAPAFDYPSIRLDAVAGFGVIGDSPPQSSPRFVRCRWMPNRMALHSSGDGGRCARSAASCRAAQIALMPRRDRPRRGGRLPRWNVDLSLWTSSLRDVALSRRRARPQSGVCAGGRRAARKTVTAIVSRPSNVDAVVLAGWTVGRRWTMVAVPECIHQPL